MSPAYDLNPIVGRQGLHLNITDKANGLDYGLAFEVMDFFRLTRADATRIYDEVPGCPAAEAECGYSLRDQQPRTVGQASRV